MKRLFCVLIIILSTACAHAAPPRSLAGLWVATDHATAYWMRLSASSTDPVVLIEDLSGTLMARSANGGDATTTTQTTTGQYLPGTRVATLNIGEPGSSRLYAIGKAPEDRTGLLELQVFGFRPAHGITFERSVAFRYKGPLAEPEDPKRDAHVASDVTPRGGGSDRQPVVRTGTTAANRAPPVVPSTASSAPPDTSPTDHAGSWCSFGARPDIASRLLWAMVETISARLRQTEGLYQAMLARALSNTEEVPRANL